jgi:hypothetical protein
MILNESSSGKDENEKISEVNEKEKEEKLLGKKRKTVNFI